ncbi:MAG TPA: DUF6152 family protein [Burkholderiales bacterium]|nr:DUF6152 family protein [Burkholderiales bacterium]
MKSSLKEVLRVAVLAGVVLGTYPVAAHHATSMFAHDKVVTISGVVKEVHWTNPHVGIHVIGAVAGERPSLWVIEMTSPGNLVRTGSWTRYSVKPGDKITIDMAPLRDGKKGGALQKMTLLDSGKFLTANIRQQERANTALP